MGEWKAIISPAAKPEKSRFDSTRISLGTFFILPSAPSSESCFPPNRCVA